MRVVFGMGQQAMDRLRMSWGSLFGQVYQSVIDNGTQMSILRSGTSFGGQFGPCEI